MLHDKYAVICILPAGTWLKIPGRREWCKSFELMQEKNPCLKRHELVKDFAGVVLW